MQHFGNNPSVRSKTQSIRQVIRNNLSWNCFCDLGRGELGTARFKESPEGRSRWFRSDWFRTIDSARIEYLVIHRVQNLKTAACAIDFFLVKERMHYRLKFSDGRISRFLLVDEDVSFSLSSRVLAALRMGVALAPRSMD